MRSLRIKIVGLTAVLSSILLFSTGYLGWKWMLKEFQDSLDTKILLPGQRIVEFHGWKNDWKAFERTIDMLIGEDWKQDRILQIRSNMYNRGVLYQSENWPAELEVEDIPDFENLGDRIRMLKPGDKQGFIRYLLLDDPHLYTATSNDNTWRMASLTNPELTLYIGINLHRHQERIRQLRLYYFSALGCVILTIGIGAYMIITRSLRPVNVIAETARNITSKDLDQRINGSLTYDREFDTLINVFNEMLERLDTSFHQAMRFSADASHELKTPLAIIQNEISIRLQKCKPESEEHETLNHILNETERLKRIIKNLFLFSQADAGKMPLTVKRYSFSDQINSFSRDMELLAEDIGLTVTQEIEEGIKIEADQLMIGQVVQNLINNAITHNHNNGFIRLLLKQTENQVMLTVENSGDAIPEEDKNRIFQRFHRGSATKTRHSPGLGLGLSLASEIVHAHHGKLQLIKSNDESTIFEMELKSG